MRPDENWAFSVWGSRGRGFESRHPDHFLIFGPSDAYCLTLKATMGKASDRLDVRFSVN
jgi:hypothetical protein